MIAEVIEIHTIQHPCSFSSLSNGGKMTVQLAFAGIATIHGVAAVGGVFELPGFHLTVADSQPLRLLTRFSQQMRSQRRRHAGDGTRAVAKLFLGDGSHQGAIHPTGVSHEHAITAQDPFAKVLQAKLILHRQRFQQAQGLESHC
ncbi:MAG: Uncharacterised protein [Synechococcus sp. MIT S9220]|nr:MAG: Uncharacterised protein [Synechococcus sp. MIT S9220]